MKLQEKGTFEYLKRKKNQNLLIMLISFAVVFAVFFAGLAVFKSRNNYCTLIATVLVLPAAKFAVAYFVLLPHFKSSSLLNILNTPLNSLQFFP